MYVVALYIVFAMKNESTIVNIKNKIRNIIIVLIVSINGSV